MQKHSSNVRLISVSFDKSMKDVERALKRSVQQDPLMVRLKELGVTGAEANISQDVLKALKSKGVNIDKTSEQAVLATLKTMGVDFEKLALLARDPFTAAFGKNADLYLVPEKHQELYFQVVGKNSVQFLFVIDQKGYLRYSGYPSENLVTNLVAELLGEKETG